MYSSIFMSSGPISFSLAWATFIMLIDLWDKVQKAMKGHSTQLPHQGVSQARPRSGDSSRVSFLTFHHSWGFYPQTVPKGSALLPFWELHSGKSRPAHAAVEGHCERWGSLWQAGRAWSTPHGMPIRDNGWLEKGAVWAFVHRNWCLRAREVFITLKRLLRNYCWEIREATMASVRCLHIMRDEIPLAFRHQRHTIFLRNIFL